jgi:hypothetical protein
VPALTRNPDDELIRRLLALERQVAAIGTLSHRTAPACKMLENTPQTFTGAAGAAVVNLVSSDSACYSTPGMADDTNHRVVIPSAGVYLQLVKVPCFTGADQIAVCDIRINGGLVYPEQEFIFTAGEHHDYTFAAITKLQKGNLLDLTFSFATHNTAASSNSQETIALSVERLHDIPGVA